MWLVVAPRFICGHGSEDNHRRSSARLHLSARPNKPSESCPITPSRNGVTLLVLLGCYLPMFPIASNFASQICMQFTLGRLQDRRIRCIHSAENAWGTNWTFPDVPGAEEVSIPTPFFSTLIGHFDVRLSIATVQHNIKVPFHLYWDLRGVRQLLQTNACRMKYKAEAE